MLHCGGSILGHDTMQSQHFRGLEATIHGMVLLSSAQSLLSRSVSPKACNDGSSRNDQRHTLITTTHRHNLGHPNQNGSHVNQANTIVVTSTIEQQSFGGAARSDALGNFMP